jgi:LuxR family maltose regulon positive regulatory protein
MVNYQIATNATCLLASVYKALDKPREAEVVLDSAIKENLVAGATASLAMAKACRAELALCRGAIEEAVQWADTLEAEPLRPGFRSVMPELVYLQVRMQQDTPESRAEVDELLATYEDFLRKTHTLPFLIKLLVLKALWEARRGDEHGALQALEEPVMLARKHGFTRMLADLGSDLVPLLNQLPLGEGGLAFVGGIIRAVSGSDRVDGEPTPAAAGPEHQTEIRVSGDVLSKREQQILQLLAERLGNAEIGEKLFISPATVKRHAHNIYEKLGVHGRREAVVKARGLGLLR